MTDAGREVKLSTLRRHVADLDVWAEGQGYGRHFPLSKDWHVAYYRSRFNGRPCYYIVHSAIEYVFTSRGGDN